MFDDNPFYTVSFVENEDKETSLNTEDTANENPSELVNTKNDFSENTTDTTTSNTEETNAEELQRDNVQQPEKEETKSTGVSTYTEVPNINKENTQCNTNMITWADKFNLWLVFAFFVWVLTSFKKKKFTKLIEKTTNIISKYSILFNFTLLCLSFILFLYPRILGTGISGKLDLFTMTEFALITVINAITFTFLSFKFLRNKQILFKKPKTFSGINFLEKSLFTFSLTGLLFFFFTESQIALCLLYFFVTLSSLFLLIQMDEKDIETYTYFYLISASIQISILGALSGLYLIMITGTLLTGYYYPEAKSIIQNIKKSKEE